MKRVISVWKDDGVCAHVRRDVPWEREATSFQVAGFIGLLAPIWMGYGMGLTASRWTASRWTELLAPATILVGRT